MQIIGSDECLAVSDGITATGVDANVEERKNEAERDVEAGMENGEVEALAGAPVGAVAPGAGEFVASG